MQALPNPALRLLSPAIGVEILDVDATQQTSEPLREQIRALWNRHGLVLFRNQQLSVDEQLRFAEIFGAVSKQGENAQRLGSFTYVSNVAKDGIVPNGELILHMDQSFYPTPLRGLMLYGLEVPPAGAGGDTVFADARLAYRNLPESLRERIAGRMALHAYDYSRPDSTTRIREADLHPDAPRAIHPVVLQHPATAEPILYVSTWHTIRILDMPLDESDALLAQLAEYVQAPGNTYRHVWRPGDVVVWDNLALQHARTNFDPSHKRHLRRIQIA